MKKDQDIFLPDTTLKYSVLKTKLKENYGLEVMDTKSKFLYLGGIILLTTLLVIKLK